MTDAPRRPELDRTQASLLVAMVVFLGLLVSGRGSDLMPSTDRLALVLAWPLVLGVIMVPRLRSWAPLVVAVFMIGGGLLLRWDQVVNGGSGSDVLAVTEEALSVLLGGGDPYNHAYQSSVPPGAPFPYPPINLLIHLPGHLLGGQYGTQLTELVGAWVVMVVLGRFALRPGQVLGMSMLALYAGLPNLLDLVGDGSNDTSTGAVLVLAVLALTTLDTDTLKQSVIAGVLAACALATKQSTLPVIVATSAWVWRTHPAIFRRYVVAGAVTLAVVSLPFLAMSGLGYLQALTSFAGFHDNVFGWNIWVLADSMNWPVASREDALVFGAIAALIAIACTALPDYRSLRTAVVAGTASLAVLFFFQRWTSFAYFAQMMSLLVLLPMLPTTPWASWAEDDPPDAKPVDDVASGPEDEPVSPAPATAPATT